MLTGGAQNMLASLDLELSPVGLALAAHHVEDGHDLGRQSEVPLLHHGLGMLLADPRVAFLGLLNGEHDPSPAARAEWCPDYPVLNRGGQGEKTREEEPGTVEGVRRVDRLLVAGQQDVHPTGIRPSEPPMLRHVGGHDLAHEMPRAGGDSEDVFVARRILAARRLQPERDAIALLLLERQLAVSDRPEETDYAFVVIFLR